MLNVYCDNSQVVSAMTSIKEIRFREEKLNALEQTKNFEQLSGPIQRTENQVQIQAGSICLPTLFLQIEIPKLLQLSSLWNNYFQKQLPFKQKKANRDS